MNSFFDANGLLNIDEIVLGMPSFKKIISDGIVADFGDDHPGISAITTHLS